jgi:N-acetylneuraminic acid mutarotase
VEAKRKHSTIAHRIYDRFQKANEHFMLKLGLLLVAANTLGHAGSAQELIWKEQAELPRSVAGYMGGVSQGKLLIIGGSYWENKHKRWSDLVQGFDPVTNTWRNETPLPAPRSDAAAAEMDGSIYIFGGGADTEVRSDALVLRDGQWTALPGAELPGPRRYPTAVSSRGYIYLLGGMSKADDYTSVTSTFWRWRAKSKGWEVLPSLPGPGRINHAMAEIGGSIYVFGGATTGAQDVRNLSDAYKYDPTAGKWSRLPDLSVERRAWWAVGLGDRALVLAGYSDDFVREVYLYDSQHNLQPVTPLPQPVADIKFFQVGNLLIGTGGEVGPGIRGQRTLQAELPKSWRPKPVAKAKR